MRLLWRRSKRRKWNWDIDTCSLIWPASGDPCQLLIICPMLQSASRDSLINDVMKKSNPHFWPIIPNTILQSRVLHQFISQDSVTLLIAHVVKRLSLSSLHSVYNERICGVYHIDLQHSFMMSGTERNRYHIHLCQIQHHYIATLMISECLSQHGLHGLGCYMHVRWMNKDDHLIHGMSIILAWFNRFDSIREQRIAAMYLYWYRISSSCSNLR